MALWTKISIQWGGHSWKSNSSYDTGRLSQHRHMNASSRAIGPTSSSWCSSIVIIYCKVFLKSQQYIVIMDIDLTLAVRGSTFDVRI